MKMIRKITTNEAAGQFWQEELLSARQTEECMHVVQCYPGHLYQQVEGFGGAFTESAAYNFAKMNENAQNELVNAYFGKDGLRYSLGRIHMNSCDFALGNYTYIEENDTTLKTFDLSHDEKEILPLLHRAAEESEQGLEVLMAPWSPPAFMKDNGEMNHGGKLKKEYYGLWADYFVKFIQEYRSRGVNLTAVTVQNEPAAVQTWDSCIYSASEEAEFAVKYLGPKLREAGLSDIDIYVWDHNKEILYDRFSEAMQYPNAGEFIRGAAVHWYTGDHFDAISMVKEEWPDARVIFTEGCVEYSRFADTNEVRKAEMYAHDMLGNLNAGISSWLDWNLFLDHLGGPNHVGNFCAAPIMCNTEKGTWEKRLSYYYIGHFSRYIQKGARRMAVTRYTDGLEVCGFLNPDGSRVMVILNKGEQDREITLRENGEGIEDVVRAHSIVTYVCNI